MGIAQVGLAEGVLNVSLLSLRQRRTPPWLLGRVVTVSMSVNLMGFPLGTALGGAVAARSPGTAFVVAAALTLVSAAGVRLLIAR